ncbi:MAG TPA: hypothetical protein VJ725_27930 [Thermoanaerobaculia bacterium]|nr:hypothetical protein [Thermoanaerobaculia bacterium]
MKKTKLRKLNLNRETLRQLISGELAGIHGAAPAGSDPSCIDGCPSAPSGCEPLLTVKKC